MYANGPKRAIDIVASAGTLIALLPLMLVVAAAIKVWDPGPVIFRQTRLGAGGRPFQFYKFRSMPLNTREAPSDRLGMVQLTWIARLIRRTNIDELPQLWNVLRGDMSLVGPRPALPGQEELIAMRRESGSLDCRPGLTGWAQVRSFDGMGAAEKARLDAEYARDVSLAKDLEIVLRTFIYLLKPPPTY